MGALVQEWAGAHLRGMAGWGARPPQAVGRACRSATTRKTSVLVHVYYQEIGTGALSLRWWL